MAIRKAITTYHQPAGGWGALKAVAEALDEQGIVVKGSASLLRINQPEGFDCPGCAWPDPKHTSSIPRKICGAFTKQIREALVDAVRNCRKKCHDSKSQRRSFWHQ